ncbi:autotransporter [Pseudomonas frederiksbergensis]|jgi:outer membrane autotransporter protein|nr:autotransporter [Pseudomonas frederiksbergensis]
MSDLPLFITPKKAGCLLAILLVGTPAVHARVLVPGESATVTNPPAPEAWAVSQGGTLTINSANALTIRSENANVVFNGGQSERIEAREGSNVAMSGATVTSSTGRGGLALSDSAATIDASTITSTNSMGLLLGRNVNTPTASSATVTGGSTISGVIGGADAVGFSVLTVNDSTLRGTGATSYGVRLEGATLSATGSTITGGQDGLQVGVDITGVNSSTVTLNSTLVTGGTGSAIVVGSFGAPGAVANINVLNGSQLNGGNGTLLQAANSSTVNVNVDASALRGNIIADTGSTVSWLMQNGSSLEGNLQNVTNTNLNSNSTLNGNVLAVAGTGAVVNLNNGSVINGNVENVFDLKLDNNSQMTGDVLSDANGSVLLNNGSVLTGQITNSSNLNINNAAQWVMTGDSTVQRLGLSSGVVRMGTNEQFQQLNIGELSGNGTFVMGTDLGNGTTDFLNVTGTASGQHQLLVSATGTTPTSAEAVKIGNIAAGDASFSLGGRETVDAGTFVYRLKKDGEGLYLNPDRDTVSPSTNTALALAGSARSVLNAEMNMLNDQIGDRGLSARPDASMRSATDNDSKLSNSVWIRTYGNQYSVDNAYGDGYSQNQNGITGGADTLVDIGDRAWVLGGFVGTSHTNMDLRYGSSATVDSVNFGVYGSTFDVQSGVFVNAMAKINQFNNKARVTMSDGTRSKGDYKALGASGSVAVGKHIRLQDDYFIEPQVRVSMGVTQSDSYRLDNGLEVKADTMRSVQGNVGVRGGRVISLDNGSLLEPSLSAGVNHEFVKTNEVRINDDSFDDDRASTAFEYGAGLKWTPAQRNWQVSGQVGGSKGTTVSQDWSGSLRVSYFF